MIVTTCTCRMHKLFFAVLLTLMCLKIRTIQAYAYSLPFTIYQPLRPRSLYLSRPIHKQGKGKPYAYTPTSLSVTQSEIETDMDLNLDLDQFQKCISISLPPQKQQEIIQDIQMMGFTSSSELYLLSKDFMDRPEALSSLLRNDFGLNPVKSNLIRGVLIRLVEALDGMEGGNKGYTRSRSGDNEKKNGENVFDPSDTNDFMNTNTNTNTASSMRLNGMVNGAQPGISSEGGQEATTNNKKPLFKSVVVNQKAKQRHTSTTQHNYGLPSNYKKIYPNLAHELDDFLQFMITPSASLQESPIRKTTATVYIRHAKLFLGWYRNDIGIKNGDDTLTMKDIFPNKEAASAQPIVDFILWLRTREISDSYEANMLRGLTKLLKFRYSDESTADPSYGEKSFGDIQAVRELRKLHRDANRRQVLSPRSSEEERKWLDWQEYLNVVKTLKEDVENEIRVWEEKEEGDANGDKILPSKIHEDLHKYTPAQRRIATKYQAYLILSFFSCVPDRQRTFRELKIGRTFIRDAKIDCWTIKHGPDDYKTGKTYGDRPPLVLAQELTYAVDDFLHRWRPCLKPLGDHFFVQSRTGKAFTQDTVYSLVARSCFKHTGKKTNPHLLRDMIVTHVRDSDASEKQLEALALYMGHSISMQRSSYDRRTMEQKVAPAVELLRSVNNKQRP